MFENGLLSDIEFYLCLLNFMQKSFLGNWGRGLNRPSDFNIMLKPLLELGFLEKSQNMSMNDMSIKLKRKRDRPYQGNELETSHK